MSIDELNDKYKVKNPNSSVKIIDIIKNSNYLIVKTKYGLCKIKKSHLFNGSIPKNTSAINPNEYFINRAKEIHRDKYDYSKLEYVSFSKKVCIICPIHGDFWQTPDNHFKSGCKKCSMNTLFINNTLTISKFIEKANKIHNDKFDYSLVEYKNAITKVKIICKEHGIFEQTPNSHLTKRGCKKCSNLNIIERNKENPSGWNKTNWLKCAKRSKQYDSFKVYIIKCWDDDEEFYKIGRTFKKINKRFYNYNLPYNYKIIQLFEFQELTEENANKAYDLETELKNKNKENKYIPNKIFFGMYECFNKT